MVVEAGDGGAERALIMDGLRLGTPALLLGKEMYQYWKEFENYMKGGTGESRVDEYSSSVA